MPSQYFALDNVTRLPIKKRFRYRQNNQSELKCFIFLKINSFVALVPKLFEIKIKSLEFIIKIVQFRKNSKADVYRRFATENETRWELLVRTRCTSIETRIIVT